MVKELNKNFKLMRKSMYDIGMKVLMEDKGKDYLDVQREQMAHGQASDGGLIGEYKNKSYQAMKERMGLLSQSMGYVNLFMTGDFVEELTLRQETKKRALVYSQDEKSKKLEKKYGSKIFGLSDGYLDVAREKFMPNFRMECAKVVFG